MCYASFEYCVYKAIWMVCVVAVDECIVAHCQLYIQLWLHRMCLGTRSLLCVQFNEWRKWNAELYRCVVNNSITINTHSHSQRPTHKRSRRTKGKKKQKKFRDNVFVRNMRICIGYVVHCVSEWVCALLCDTLLWYVMSVYVKVSSLLYTERNGKYNK